MTKGAVPGDWTEQYAGSKLDLSGFKLSFSDEFDTMDVVPNNGTGNWFAPVHAPFGAAKFMSPVGATNPFSVSNGQLTISMKQVDGVWQSGTMQTVNSAGQGFAQEYGYFEMRAAFNGGAGAWPAFWMLPQDTSIPRPEVDIVEAYGGDPDGHHQAVHLSDSGTHDWDSNYSGLASSMFDGTFHTYGAMITADWIIVYCDGQELSRFPMNDFLRTPLYMVVSLAMNPSEVTQASGTYDMVVDYVRAYAAPDVTEQYLQGTDGANNLAGGRFDDFLDGGAGADTMSGGPGADTMRGGAGNDTYHVDNAGDTVDERGGNGTDRVLSSVTYSLANTARVFGVVENLTLTGTKAINAAGNALNNAITGNVAANVLSGGAGADTMSGGPGADTMSGGTGNDTYYVDNAGDKVDERGGDGIDRVLSSVTYSLANTARMFGAVENFMLTGTKAISATGNTLNNVITGNAAANVLSGGAGNDTLKGLAGNDRLCGGLGRDTLNGGPGNDIFTFDSRPGSTNIDRIVDFHNVSGDNDSFQLENAIFTRLGPVGPLKPGFFFSGPSPHDANDHIIYNKATGALYYDSDGLGGHVQVQIAVLSNKVALTANDFNVI